MVQMSRTRVSSSSKVSPLHIFLTIFLCGISFYTGIVSSSDKKCPTSAGKLDIEAIVQQRLEAGEFMWPACIL